MRASSCGRWRRVAERGAVRGAGLSFTSQRGPKGIRLGLSKNAALPDGGHEHAGRPFRGTSTSGCRANRTCWPPRRPTAPPDTALRACGRAGVSPRSGSRLRRMRHRDSRRARAVQRVGTAPRTLRCRNFEHDTRPQNLARAVLRARRVETRSDESRRSVRRGRKPLPLAPRDQSPALATALKAGSCVTVREMSRAFRLGAHQQGLWSVRCHELEAGGGALGHDQRLGGDGRVGPAGRSEPGQALFTGRSPTVKLARSLGVTRPDPPLPRVTAPTRDAVAGSASCS
jgi:hypothetical protein